MIGAARVPWLRVLGLVIALGLVTPDARAAEPADQVPGGERVEGPPEAPPADEVPIVELYTMGQGDLVFEKFGHAAMCLRYAARRRVRCFNYGTTDFDSVVPLFWGFVRGESLFWVSASGKKPMTDHYREADRSIWRQVLALSPEEARRVAEMLEHDARPENREYRYHHFDDNCATRLRDILDHATEGRLSKDPDDAERPTFRQITRAGFAGSTAILLASDLLMGRAADRRPSAYEAMFLPDVLRHEVAARFEASPEEVFRRTGPDFEQDPGVGGRWLWLLLAALFAAPPALARWRGRAERLGLALGAFPLALLGLVLWTVAVASPLPELRFNEALLLFVPTDAALPFLRPTWRRRYALARLGILILASLLLAAGVLRQPLWTLLPMPLGVMTTALLGRTRRPRP